MVNRIIHHQAQPELDESWWSALLAEEEKYAPAERLNQAAKEASAEKRAAVEHPSGVARAPAKPIDWGHAQELFENDLTINLQVNGFNRGGLLVSSDGLHGFVPVSHLIDIHCQMDEQEREPLLEAYVGRAINLKVIECDPERGRVVFSERAALATSGKRNQLFGDIKPGERVFGTVTNVTDFGVFVDLGGVEGLIHVSELSWGRVRHPADVVCVGEQVAAHVIQVDKSRSRIALSLKRLRANPWETAETRYFSGQVVDAVITSVVPFGAFARLEEGLDGLIHVTEFNSLAAQDQAFTVCEGQRVRVRVLNVDADRQRLGLSLRLSDQVDQLE